MIKSKEIEGPSCLTAAADDEPLFVLRANDEVAAYIVNQWAYAYYLAKGGAAHMTTAQLAKYDAIDGDRRMTDMQATTKEIDDMTTYALRWWPVNSAATVKS